MKKLSYLLLMLFPGFVTMGCSDDDKAQIALSNQSKQEQRVYADEKTTDDITFTAQSTWMATISAGTAASRSTGFAPMEPIISWLRLLHNGKEKYNGEAGTFTLTAELEPNYSGQDRSAVISIICGTEKATITVTQSKTTASGKANKLISKIIYHDEIDITLVFFYDSKGRVISINEMEEDEVNATLKYTYEGNTLTRETTNSDGVKTQTYSLNSQGYIESYTEAPSNQNGHTQEICKFTYDKEGYLIGAKKEYSNEYGNGTKDITVKWEKGNFTEIDYNRDGVDDYTYYSEYENHQNLDLALALADFEEELPFLGLTGKRAANLLHEMKWNSESPEDLTVYSYEFDNDGYVSKIFAEWNNEPKEQWYTIVY